MMYQPSCRFSDSDDIVIIRQVPYYRLNGKTYRDRLKNRLSIDYDILFNTPPPIEESLVPPIEITKQEHLNKEKERKKQKRISSKYDAFSMYEGFRPIAKKNRQKLRKHTFDKYDNNDKKINKLNILRNKTIKNKKRYRSRREKLLFIKENTEEETEEDENDWDYFWDSFNDDYADFDYYYNW